MMLQELLAIAVILGSFEPFCTAKKAPLNTIHSNSVCYNCIQSECPPECPPGFVAREINGGFYSCDQFSLGGSEGKGQYFYQFELVSQFHTLHYKYIGGNQFLYAVFHSSAKVMWTCIL